MMGHSVKTRKDCIDFGMILPVLAPGIVSELVLAGDAISSEFIVTS